MTRLSLLVAILASGCTTYGIVGIDDKLDTGEVGSDPTGETLDPTDPTDTTDTEDPVDTEDTEPDYSEYDGADLRIITPGSGDFLALEEVHDFEAEITAADGSQLDWDEIAWTSDADELWYREGQTFEDDLLDVGLHDITAETTLPNGDRLAHTIGGVLVQSRYAGTYTGLFSSSVIYDGLEVGCGGVANLVIDPYGEVALGDGSCLVDLLGFELELAYLYELENDEGELVGTASVDIFGWFEFPFEAEGFVDPDEGLLEFTFAGDVDIIAIDGGVDAERISLDAGL